MGWRKSKKYLILINKLRKYRFARRNWRARIETSHGETFVEFARDSPAVIGGRGLKHFAARHVCVDPVIRPP